MANEQSPEEGRKSARGESATKRDEDVLQSEENGEDKAEKIQAAKTGASRRGDDEAGDEAATEEEPKSEPQDEQDAPQAAAEPADSPQKAATKEPAEEPKEPVDVVEAGQQWLASLFERMNLKLKARGQESDGTFTFNISGDDADDLIGSSRQSPRTLTALQTLLAEHVGREYRGKIHVDIGGYKQKRQQRLESIADQLGEAVRRTGRRLKIAGLNSFERRVIHQRLADANDVDTESIDQGIFRKLQVNPD